MKKTLIALSLVSMFSVVACTNDGFMLNDNRPDKVESSDSFSLETAYTGPGKDYKPTVDPEKKFNLYQVHTDRDNNNCKSFQFIEDQLTMDECQDKRAALVDADGTQKDAQEAEANGEKSRWYPMSGPHAGKLRWIYTCQTETFIKNWIDRSTKCE